MSGPVRCPSRMFSNSDAQVCYAPGFDEYARMNKLKDVGASFRRCHFEREVIGLCVRWYRRYKGTVN